MKQPAGFTLLEVLVALALIGTVTASLSPIFAMQMQMNTDSELRTAAMEASQRRIDMLRFLDPATLPNAGSTNEVIAIDGRDFQVTTHYCSYAAMCDVVTRHLTVRASYRNKVYYETQTVFTQLQ